MSTTTEIVNHPSEFEHDFLKNMVGVPAIDPERYSPFYTYLAVFDKTRNYPGEKYNELLKDSFSPEAIVDVILNQTSHRQYEFSIGGYDGLVDTWFFQDGAADQEKPQIEVVTVIDVTTRQET